MLAQYFNRGWVYVDLPTAKVCLCGLYNDAELNNVQVSGDRAAYQVYVPPLQSQSLSAPDSGVCDQV